MEIIKYPRLTSSPISPETLVTADGLGLPSPHLTEPSQSPKNSVSSANVTVSNAVRAVPNAVRTVPNAVRTVPNAVRTVPSLSNENPNCNESPNCSSNPNYNDNSNANSNTNSNMLRSLSASASPNMNFTIGKSPTELTITEYSNKELKAMKKRCRTVMAPSQSRVLRKVLEQTAFPSTEIRENLAKLLGMKPRTVQIWFQNQRQKSRQGRGSSSSDDLQLDSPNSSGSDDEMMSVSSSPFESSPTSMSSKSNASSPGFTALTAAAFALSHNPIDNQQTQGSHSHQQQQQQNQRYTTFHGAVYKSVPGGPPPPLPNVNYYRGNTAAAMNAKRMASAQGHIMNNGNFAIAATNNYAPINNYAGNFTMPPPSQPQNIPSYNQNPISLDVLASAVSKFRPNGYNYFMKPPSPPVQPYQITQSINRNRLAPLRTESPPSDASCAKLPSLKDLAHVAVTELDHHHPQLQRGKSFSFSVESEATDLALKLAEATRRFSSSETISNNALAPNSSASTRRPW